MKIYIENKAAVVIFMLITRPIKFFMLFLVLWLLLVFNLDPTASDRMVQMTFVIAGILPGIFALFIAVDGIFYARKTSLAVKENAILLTSGNIMNDSTHTFMFSQLSSLLINQNFIHKVLGICQIDLVEENKVTSVWGFSKQSAEDFVSQVNNRFKIKIS